MTSGDKTATGEPSGIYIHVPLCRRICAYCDFYKVAAQSGDAARLVDALCREMEGLPAAFRALEVTSLYLGGGTPTLLGGEELQRLLAFARSRFRVAEEAEVTVEANPEDAEAHVLSGALAAGVNRLSIGVQSFDAKTLETLARNHTPGEAIEAIRRARLEGFRNLNIDLMIGLPGESLSVVERTLAAVLDLDPEHLSIYLLDLAKETPLRERVRSGRLPEPDEEESRLAYELVMEKLTGAGYHHYEISNLAKPGYECRHNICYWTDRPYVGLGPAAASYVGTARFTRKPDLDAYLAEPSRLVTDPEAFDREELAAERLARDALILGLRLIDGVDTRRIRDRYGPIESIQADLASLTADGLLEWDGDRCRIPARFLPVADSIWAKLV